MPALTCPTEPIHAINADLEIDLEFLATLEICANNFIQASLGLYPTVTIPGIDNFSLSLGMFLPDQDDFDLAFNNSCLNEEVGSELFPLILHTTKSVKPIVVTTILPTSVEPLNSLSAVKPTPPGTLPFTSIEPTSAPTFPPTIIQNPTVTIPPGSPCADESCNSLNF